MPIDLAAAYEETRDDLVALARSLSSEQLAATVPASPDWTVHDVLTHLTGVAFVVATGGAPKELNLLAAMNDPSQAQMRDDMNDAELEKRRGRSLDEILDEWSDLTDRLLPMIRGEEPFPYDHPFLGHVLVTDLATHAQDVRNALGRPGNRESAGVGVALASYATALAFKLQARGLPALRIRYGDKERIAGDGEPANVERGPLRDRPCALRPPFDPPDPGNEMGRRRESVPPPDRRLRRTNRDLVE